MSLDIEGIGMGDAGATALTGALRVNSTLVSLDIEGNSNIGPGHAALFKMGTTNFTLRYLRGYDALESELRSHYRVPLMPRRRVMCQAGRARAAGAGTSRRGSALWVVVCALLRDS